MEGGVLMAKTIEKINDTTIAEIGTQEVRRIYGKAELIGKKAQLEERLAEINTLLDAFK